MYDDFVDGCNNNLPKSTLKNIVITSGESIDDWAFVGCGSLKSILFSESSEITSIGKYAFRDCRRITSITIPNSVRYVSSGAFTDCTGLSNVYYRGTYEEWKKITDNRDLADITQYYYSEEKPTDTEYEYWHYVGGVPTKWE